MAYIAKHYVSIAGVDYTPGEVIYKMPAKERERFLRVGAVEHAPHYDTERLSNGFDASSEDTVFTEDTVITGDAVMNEDAVLTGDDVMSEDASDETVEAPVIDAADGIINEPAQRRKKA